MQLYLMNKHNLFRKIFFFFRALIYLHFYIRLVHFLNKRKSSQKRWQFRTEFWLENVIIKNKIAKLNENWTKLAYFFIIGDKSLIMSTFICLGYIQKIFNAPSRIGFIISWFRNLVLSALRRNINDLENKTLFILLVTRRVRNWPAERFRYLQWRKLMRFKKKFMCHLLDINYYFLNAIVLND